MEEEIKGFIVAVKVVPKASRSQVVGWEGECLKVRLAAVPEKGEANTELIRFLAKELKIGKSLLELVQGQTSRHKKLRISGISKEAFLSRYPPISKQ